MENGYRTSELEIAAFLKSRGHRLLDAKLKGRFVEFEFEERASHDISQYFCGALVSAQELFEAHRALRITIKQLQEHSEEKSRNDRHAHRK